MLYSASGFSHVKYELDNDQLVIELKYNRLTSKENPTGDFRISIEDDFSEVNQVFIKGEQEADLVEIWSR
ncbi:hypothetical protein [Amphibacillus marinus]|uniref:hypothetical protein n=1 Tax=Amphibacillus marinus TaxID=872970 RepID=UPI000B8865E2|nr:hypothetical protein [Amphibacillus marinus]